MTVTKHRRVLVAVDDSEAAAAVARFVNRFFDGLDVDVLALHVGGLPAPWYPTSVSPGGVFPWPYLPAAEPRSDVAGDIEAERRRGAEVIAESGVASDGTVVAMGDPVVKIEEVADEHDVDLVVVGEAHRGFLERLWSPSPATELAGHGRRPVLIVR